MNNFTWTAGHVDAAGGAACVILTALGYLAIVSPLLRQGDQLQSVRTDLAVRQQRVTELASTQLGTRLQLSSLLEQQASDTVSLQPRRYLNTRLADITDLVSARGMIIDGTELGDAEERQWNQIIPIKLSGSGSFRDFAAFLRGLRESIPDTGVMAFQLSGNPQDPTSPLSFQVDLAWFSAAALVSAPE